MVNKMYSWCLGLFIAINIIEPFASGEFNAHLTLQNVWEELPQLDVRSLIKCIGTDGNQKNLRFSRKVDTGKGPRLPRYTHTAFHGESASARILIMPSEDKLSRFGAFQCRETKEGVFTDIVTLKLPPRSLAELEATTPYHMANSGDDVEIEVTVLKEQQLPVRWRHNGKAEIAGWNDQLKVELKNVTKNDDGIYECYYEGRRKEGVHAIMRLIVRGCPADKYGPDCDDECPTCYNGGVCHDRLGVCICPAGFTGPHCERACGGNHFGEDCKQNCSQPQDQQQLDEKCALYLLCKPDPYGCSCAPGFTGSKCADQCQPGKYGANCKQHCHCASGSSACNRFTGACEGGCKSGWRGASCQIEDPDATPEGPVLETTTSSYCPQGKFGAICDKECHCAGHEPCGMFTGHCPSGCETGWGGPTCSVCASGRFGENCESTCHCLGGSRNCDKDGFCYTGCEAGWAGFTCQQGCAPGRFGTNCAFPCHCNDGPDACDKFNGTCTGDCKPGYMDVDCQTFCAADKYGINCLNSCQCINGGQCSRLDGTCTCQGRWKGNICNESEPRIVAAADGEVNIGQPMYISCTADGIPLPGITITSGNFSSLNVSYRTLEQNQLQAVVKVQPHTAGEVDFYCIAQNEHERDKKLIKLFVIGPPKLMEKPKVVQKTNNSITVNWREWDADKDDGGKLGDHIEYMVVYRKAGAKEWEKPEWWKTAVSSKLENLESNTEYEIAVACRRPGKGGEGEEGPYVTAKTECGVPSASSMPGDFLSERLLPTSVKLGWTAPSEEQLKCPLTGYKLKYHPQDDPSSEEDVEIPETPEETVLSHLIPNTDYVLRLFAVTSLGPTQHFAELIITTPESVPGPIENLQCLTEGRPDHLLVTWLEPKMKNGVIKNYIVHYDLLNPGLCGESEVEHNTSKTSVVVPRDTNVTLVNLLPYSRYAVSVRARTSAGEGNVTETIVTTEESTPNMAPPNLRVIKATSTSLQYEWDEIPCEGTNGEIIEYEYTLSPEEGDRDGGDQKRKKRDSTTKENSSITKVSDTEVSVTNLQPYREYRFAVRGLTHVGPGPFSDSISHRTAEAVPLHPRFFAVSSSLSRSIFVTWLPPFPSHGEILKYRITHWETRDLSSEQTAILSLTPSNDIKEKFNQQISGLRPATNYTLKIQAATIVGWGNWSDELIASTAEDVPYAPAKVFMAASARTTLKIAWKPPTVTNGIITSYKITYRPILSLDQMYNVSEVEDVEMKTDGNSFNIVLENLHPSTEYSFLVSAATSAGYGEAAAFSCWTIISIEHVSSSIETLDEEVTNESIPIFFSTIEKSSVSKYQVIVEDASNDEQINESLLADFETAVVKQKLPYYIAAELDPQNVSDSGKQYFVVGDKKNWGGFTNVHLNPGHKYKIRIRTLVWKDNQIKPVLSDPGGQISITSVSYADKKELKVLGMDFVWFLVILIGGLVLCSILLFFLVLAICRRKQKKKAKKGDFLAKDSGLSESMTWSVKYKVSGKEAVDGPVVADGMRPVSNKEKVFQLRKNTVERKVSRGIRIDSLADYLNSVASTRLPEEFKQLAAGQIAPWTIARKSENLKKNRYGNILPYDRNRVVLRPSPNVSNSDYINASYVDGYNRTKEYIVTQGPLDGTVVDFWRMVWQENVPVIVMITDLIENGKSKCAKYWPDDSMECGNLQILLIHTDQNTDFIIRTILLRNMDIGRIHRVHQYQFIGWPDRIIPSNACFLLKMQRRIRSDHPAIEGPIVIHCSAGSGRTGTFLCLDALIQQAEEQKRIDVFGFVNSARMQRINLVQTLEQYLFIHEALLEAVQYEDTSVALEKVTDYIKEAKNAQFLEQTSFIKTQYHTLNKTQRKIGVHRCSDALSEYNIFKNRDPMIVPADATRLKLKREAQEVANDYINAISVASYRQKDAFIVTQSPLNITIEDFWHLVYQYKSSLILMLNDCTKDDEEDVGQYWPDKGQARYGMYEVQVVTFEDQGELIIRIMKLMNHTQPSEDPHKIIHLQYKAWSHEQQTPTVPSILNLVEQVELWYRRSSNGPITIHCLDGSTRSGLFCALTYISDQMKAEGKLDVFQVVKHIRTNRPEFIPNLEQYIFCFEVAQEIMDSLTHCSGSLRRVKKLSVKM